LRSLDPADLARATAKKRAETAYGRLVRAAVGQPSGDVKLNDLVLRYRSEHPQARVWNLFGQVSHMQSRMHLRPSTSQH
jgi:hypothetical protein